MKAKRTITLIFLLSDQQSTIIRYLSNGLTVKQIASKMYLSINGINYHKRQIFSKLDAKTSAEAVSIAKSKGII